MARSRLYETELGASRLIGRLEIHIPMPAAAKTPPVRRPVQMEAEDGVDAPNQDADSAS